MLLYCQQGGKIFLNINDAIARNVRAVREQKKLTLDGAAELTGVSRSMLAQIEKGEVNPTISVVWKIANGFKVSFTSLVEPPEEGVAVLPCREPLEEDQGRYLNYPAFPFDETRLFETYRIIIQPQGRLEAQPHLRGTEEYITVFRGTVEIGVAGVLHQLNTGDSIRFPADVPHSYTNPGTEEAQLSMLIYYRPI